MHLKKNHCVYIRRKRNIFTLVWFGIQNVDILDQIQLVVDLDKVFRVLFVQRQLAVAQILLVCLTKNIKKKRKKKIAFLSYNERDLLLVIVRISKHKLSLWLQLLPLVWRLLFLGGQQRFGHGLYPADKNESAL